MSDGPAKTAGTGKSWAVTKAKRDCVCAREEEEEEEEQGEEFKGG